MQLCPASRDSLAYSKPGEHAGNSPSLLGPELLPCGIFSASCVAAGFPWVLQRFEVFGPSPCHGAWGLLEVNLGKEEGGWRGRRDTAQGPVFCLTMQSAWLKGSCNPSKLPLILGPWTLPMRPHSHILFTFDCCPVAKNSNTHIKKPCFPGEPTLRSPVSHTGAHSQAWRRRVDPPPFLRPGPFTASSVAPVGLSAPDEHLHLLEASS